MKILTYMLVSSIVLMTFVTTALGDAFSDFRTELQRNLPDGWSCGEVRTLEKNTLFDVNSSKNRYKIVITRREFLSQQEWTDRSQRVKKAMDGIIAGDDPKNVDATIIDESISLPDAWYNKIAMSIGLSEPDIWYSEIESDGREAKSVLKTILGKANLYKRDKESEQAAPRNR